ncbi:MAG: purine nucleoside phosphorylase [Gaiellaceae bacterium]|nr:MAG: purine nucleoside phosphorylase [Gaiellaceae bacterium]
MLERAVARIREETSLEPRVGLVLGSGLGGVAEEVAERVVVPYADIPGWPISTAIGHAGRLVLGRLGDVPVAVMQGRVHLYEGVSPEHAVFGIRVLGRLGVETLVVTNAAGAINDSYRPGMLVVISDHVNLLARSPLVGPNDERLGPRFPDMSDAYDPALRALAREVADRLGLETAEGVYGAWLGPQFETPAEIRFMRLIGCDLAGMSTVPEVIAARHMGIRCLGISVVTNMAAGIAEGKLGHEEVLEVGARTEPRLTALLRELVPLVAEL